MPTLATMTCEEITAALIDAETAYGNLLMGKSARVLVDNNGERVEFTSANQAKLGAYVEQLRRRQATVCAIPSASAPITGPLRFTF